MADAHAAPQAVAPAEYRKFIEAETEKWGKIIKVSGATVE